MIKIHALVTPSKFLYLSLLPYQLWIGSYGPFHDFINLDLEVWNNYTLAGTIAIISALIMQSTDMYC